MKTIPIVALAALATAVSAKAQQTEVNISGDVNANIQGYTDGSNYQLGGSTLDVNGVNFGLALDGTDPNSTGVVQSSGTTFDYTFAVPSGTQATTLYSLANTAFGAAGVTEAELVVTGTHGETATLDLVEGDNIRDHNEDGFVNTLSDSTVVPTYFLSGAPTSDPTQIQTRLDMQTLQLGSAFDGDTIASIDFELSGGNGAGYGEAFLAGLTLVDQPAGVPDSPLPLAFTGGVFALLLGVASRNRKLAM